MKLYQIILLTLSTVSLTHCSQQQNQNEDSNAAYHIEFEDKSVHGGYGYKVQVAGKQKYQESWKKDHPTAPPAVPIASGSSDYAQNNYATSGNSFTPEVQSFTKQEENNYAQESLTNSGDSFNSEKQYSGVSSFAPSSDNISYRNKQTSESSSYLNDQTQPSYSTVNNYNSYAQHVSKPKSPLSSQSSFTSHNYGSSNQDWQVTSQPKFETFSQYSNKPSVKIMGTNYHGSANIGPQVFVESISGKLNHYPHSYQVDSRPQIHFALNHGPSSNVFQHSVKSPVSSHTNIPIEYYHQTSQTNYKPTAHKSQYESQLTSVPAVQSNNYEDNNSNDNIGYSVKYSTQFASPVSSQSANQYESYVVQNPSLTQYTNPSTQFVQEPKLKHTKGNTLYKSVTSSYKYAPQHQTVQYIPVQDSNHGLENILHKPSVSVNQYTSQISSNPSQQFASEQGIYDNAHYNQLSSNYAAEAPMNQYTNQEITKYVSHQPSPSVQFKPSVQLATDYSQLLQQYPQESLSSLQSYTKKIPQQHLYSTNQPTAHKNVVSYHYKQEFPATTTNSYMSPQPQQVSLNPYGVEGLSYNNLLNGYNAQSMLGHVPNNIHVSSSQQYGNAETQKDQFLYAPALAYGYGSQLGNGQGVFNQNAFNNVASNAYLNGLQFRRRSSGEADRKPEVDQKQTE